MCENLSTTNLAKYCQKDHVHPKSCSNECISVDPALPGEHEAKIKSKKSLTEVRELISKQPEIQTLLRDTMQGVICTLNEIFKNADQGSLLIFLYMRRMMK